MPIIAIAINTKREISHIINVTLFVFAVVSAEVTNKNPTPDRQKIKKLANNNLINISLPYYLFI